jgi:hypothetical protein
VSKRNEVSDDDTPPDGAEATGKPKRRGLFAPDEPVEGAVRKEKVVRPDFDPAEGRWIIQASWAGTVVFTIAAVIGTIWLSAAIVTVVVSLVLFALGTVAFVAAYARAVSRSRQDNIGMGGLFFLAGRTAPARVQALLLGSLGVQTAVAFTAASIRIYTALAFGILVPMFGLGLAGLWGALHGRFDPRPPDTPVRKAPAKNTSAKRSSRNGPTRSR